MKGVESMFRRPGPKLVAYLQNRESSFRVCVCETETACVCALMPSCG